MKEKTMKINNSIHLHLEYQLGFKETILFLHFSGGTNQMWNGVIPHFNQSYNIMAPDFRGHENQTSR
jgi:2-succinyl-6-hydroxy-2,4-cyclohexadiene-1-carboxylate synthase